VILKKQKESKFMRYENWISYRYLIASKGRFLTFLNIVSITGVAIGVAALIVVIGVMTGFGNNLREKIIGTTPHVMIEKEVGIRDYQTVIDKISGLPGVKGISPYIQGSLFLESYGQARGVAVRGIIPETEHQITKVKQYLKSGSLENLKGETVIVGSELAEYYGYEVGDKITLIAPGSGISGSKWKYQLTVVGIFKTGMADFDLNLILINLKAAQSIFNYPQNSATGVGVSLNNPHHAEAIKNQLYGMIGYGFLVRTWVDINRNLFEALFLEKWGLFIILTLMVIVASFNIISTLIVTVTTKIHDIGILKSLGVPKKSIRKIFMKQGVFIGTLGTFWGLAGGFSLSYILSHYIKVPEEIYSIDRVPLEIQPFDVTVIVVAALLISYLASIYPAAKAANLQPVEALRYH
jgi:lipoprotein-releasing system permease protein